MNQGQIMKRRACYIRMIQCLSFPESTRAVLDELSCFFFIFLLTFIHHLQSHYSLKGTKLKVEKNIRVQHGHAPHYVLNWHNVACFVD